MNVAVVGLGTAGAVIAASLARAGHRVLACDRDDRRADAVRAGRGPVVEPGLDERIASAVAARSLEAVRDASDAVAASSFTLVCVGTPALAAGGIDLEPLDDACDAIGRGLRRAAPGHRVVIRSTVPPGTARHRVVPRLEAASGLAHRRGFQVVVQPEFLREGTALRDFDAPSRLVVGAFDDRAAEAVVALAAPGPGCDVLRTDPEGAELAKLADNAWHALKVAFANEIGALARACGTDGSALMASLSRDRVLNLSPAYLRPGAPFGGGCLPKDVAALAHAADLAGVELALVAALRGANDAHARRVLADVVAAKPRRAGLLGLAFKPGTADLRDSPYLALARSLATRGIGVRAWDRLVPRDDPRCDATWFVPSPEALADEADVIVICHADEGALAAMEPRLTARHRVIDLDGGARGRVAAAHYLGMAWTSRGTA